MKIKQEIPVFFSSDDNYVPCLTVAIHSLIQHTSKENYYSIIVLTTGMSEENRKEIKKMSTENVKINFEDVSESLKEISKELKLRLRDYYSIAIYYRLFIPKLFPIYEKAIYLDADMVILSDIADLYNKDMGNNLLMATTDSTVNDSEDFRKYSKIALGIEPEQYINSGMLVMNLREMRKANIEQKFIYLLEKYNLETAAPDQDYLNVLCKGRIKYISERWDKMPDFGAKIPAEELHIIHYNMMRKPWHYADVPYSDIFWKYAKQTKFYESLQEQLKNYTEEQKQADMQGIKNLVNLTNNIIEQEIKFVDVVHETNMITDDTSFTDEEFISSEGLI